jgi:hypothetical protein
MESHRVTWVTLGACRRGQLKFLGNLHSTCRRPRTVCLTHNLEGPTTDVLIRYQLLDSEDKRKPCNLQGGISPVKSASVYRRFGRVQSAMAASCSLLPGVLGMRRKSL